MKIGVCLPNGMKKIQLIKRSVQVVTDCEVRSFLHFFQDMLQTQMVKDSILVFRMTHIALNF
ncbi:hypothetical protein BMS3Bbin04_00051 [bacterium BMS3Bbin04]|nr:hypothetical protein BMS3Bbin04_00051 [bacterium BMS3Bbin04]